MDTIEMCTLELSVKEMTYLDAFLFLTMDHNMHARVAMMWLEHLSEKYPQSRLGVHHKHGRYVYDTV